MELFELSSLPTNVEWSFYYVVLTGSRASSAKGREVYLRSVVVYYYYDYDYYYYTHTHNTHTKRIKVLDSSSSSSSSNQATGNSGRDTSITSLPQYENSPGTPTNENYWWLTANPFQKPPNHPGVEKGATAPGPSNSNYGNAPASNSGSYNKFPSNQQNSPSYGPSSNVQAQAIPQRPKPAPASPPQYQPSQNTGSYGGSGPSGNGWNGPASPSGPQAPIKLTQGYRPPDIDFNTDCQLTNKADCHGPPSSPLINPGYNQVDSPSSLPEISVPSYTQPKPQAPVPQTPVDNPYGSSPLNPYSPSSQVELVPPQPAPQPSYQPQPAPQPSYQPQPAPQPSYQPQPAPQPAPQPSYQPAPQPAPQPSYQPAPQIQPKPQIIPAPAPVQQPSYQVPAAPSTNYNTGWSASSGSPQPQPGPSGQSQPSYTGPSNQYQSAGAPSVVPAPSRPVQSNPQSFNQNYRPIAPSGNANNNNYADQLPYPGCPAAMLCVPDNRCNAKGVIEESPIVLSPAELQFRVALVACSAPSTGAVGVCCRDPNYKDPWPDMNGNGGNKQHHHHHDDSNKGQGGGFNPNISQQGASSAPSNNFNSYSGAGYSGTGDSESKEELSNGNTTTVTCQLDEDCIDSSICRTDRNSSDHSQTLLQKCKEDIDGVQYICCTGRQDDNIVGLDAASSQLDLVEISKVNEAIPVLLPTDEAGLDTTERSSNDNASPEILDFDTDVPVPKIEEADSIEHSQEQEEQLGFRFLESAEHTLNQTESEKVPTGDESEIETTIRPVNKKGKRIRIKLVSKIGGHPNGRSFGRVRGSSPSNLTSSFRAVSHSSQEVFDGDLITANDSPDVSANENSSSEETETRITSRSKIIDVPLRREEKIVPKLVNEPKLEFLFPPNSELPFSTKAPTIAPLPLTSLNPRRVPNVKKDKVHNQIIIDLETVYKGRSVVANVQNGSSPFNARSTTTLNPTTIITTTMRTTQESSSRQRVTTAFPSSTEVPETNSTSSPVKKQEDRSKSHLYPFFHGTDSPRGYVISETGEKIEIPSQHFETPSLTPEDRLRLILPPRLEEAELELEMTAGDNETDVSEGSGEGEITFFSPLAANKNIVVDTCPQNMKCLSETYCSTVNPEEGDADAFDIRLQFRKKSSRQRCRQPNLPVNGYCCYLREDFEAVPEIGGAEPSDPASELSIRIQKKAPVRHCGVRRPDVQNPKTNDEDTSFGEFPWQALILRRDQPSCGGALLSERLIATSASCVNTTAMNDIIIRVGDWDADHVIEAKEHQEILAEDYFVHPGFKSNSLFTINDIAIIRTKQNITFDYHVARICLPNAYDKFDDQRCIATGWYTTTPNNTDEADFSVQLKQMSVTILPRNICQNKLQETTLGSRFSLPGGSICGSGDPSLTTCVVEAGGPLICENEQTGSYTLAGIFGWGNACGDEVGVYSSVTSHAEWIYSVMQRESGQLL
ncbi:unnamed protein product [Allacma fusca]|uniref:Peptidase S1 domain-containing protein n=1 Tax=Allacma fusca TaxID=39272 RepID=A0A8J2PWL5_9HEXA|nr:unnamed protein product [Allacma fusca]